jgi:hypothetical protein
MSSDDATRDDASSAFGMGSMGTWGLYIKGDPGLHGGDGWWWWWWYGPSPDWTSRDERLFECMFP